MQNVRSLILFMLDIISDNYMRWREQFLMALGKFFLERLVLDDRTATSRIGCGWTMSSGPRS